jgi:hypothetical protein
MDSWLSESVARLGGGDPLSDADVKTLLDLARVAAHESGERTNAPLICYLVGVAQGRGQGSLADLATAAAGEQL